MSPKRIETPTHCSACDSDEMSLFQRPRWMKDGPPICARCLDGARQQERLRQLGHAHVPSENVIRWFASQFLMMRSEMKLSLATRLTAMVTRENEDTLTPLIEKLHEHVEDLSTAADHVYDRESGLPWAHQGPVDRPAIIQCVRCRHHYEVGAFGEHVAQSDYTNCPFCEHGNRPKNPFDKENWPGDWKEMRHVKETEILRCANCQKDFPLGAIPGPDLAKTCPFCSHKN